MDVEQLTPTQYLIIKQISRHFQRLGAELGIYAAINSWGDTLPESEVLAMLEEMLPNG